MHRLLIVEDQKKLLASLRRVLVEEGYEVATASTGEAAYFLATTETFDAVVLDLMLPDRNGLQVLKELRSYGLVPTPPFLECAEKRPNYGTAQRVPQNVPRDQFGTDGPAAASTALFVQFSNEMQCW